MVETMHVTLALLCLLAACSLATKEEEKTEIEKEIEWIDCEVKSKDPVLECAHLEPKPKNRVDKKSE